MLSEKLLDHFQNPRNAGALDPPAAVVEVSNPACGDILRLSYRWEDGRISDCRYQVLGCTASIAAGSALAEWLPGRDAREMQSLTAATVEEWVGGLIPESKHAAVLMIDGVRSLLRSAGATHPRPRV